MREKTCCFTGHREILESEGAVKARLMGILEELIHQGYRYFGAGGARGFDSLAAKTVLELKEKASKVVHLQKKYSKGCYYRRNEHLIDHSSMCVFYQYKNVGGTAYTTRYAERQKVMVINCFKF